MPFSKTDITRAIAYAVYCRPARMRIDFRSSFAFFFYPTAVAASLATVLPQKEEGPMGDRCQLLCPGMYTPSAARARAAVSFI